MGKPIRRTMWVAAACAGLLIGCGEQTDSTTDTVSSTSAFETRVSSLSVNMKGKPAADANVEAVLVDVAQVNAVYEDGTVVTISDVLTTYDLVELGSGVAALIGQIDLPAGVLTEITLDIASASVTVDGVSSSLTVPSGTIRIKIDSVLIADGCSTEISLDFDAAASLKKRGKNGYLFTPSVSTSDFTTDCPEPPSEPDGGADAGTGDDGGVGDDAGTGDDAGDPPPEDPSFPVNVQYLWTNTSLMATASRMVGIPYTDDVAFGLAVALTDITAVKRATVTETGLVETWSYDASDIWPEVHSAAYDSMNDRLAFGGIWPDGRNARVFDATSGTFLWSSFNYNAPNSIHVTVFDEFGRLWTAKSASGASAIRLFDASGTQLGSFTTTSTNNPTYNFGVAVGDGSGDVIVSAPNLLQRLSFDGAAISPVWSQTVSMDVDPANGQPLLVANGQLHHGTESATDAIQHRDLSTGAVLAETDWAALRQNAFHNVKDLSVDAYGDIWVLGSANSSSSSWDLIRFDADWNVRSNWAVDLAGHPILTAFSGAAIRPSSVRVTESGFVILGGFADSGKGFHAVAGKLVE